MKYLREFKTATEFQTAYGNNTLEIPNVSLTLDDSKVRLTETYHKAVDLGLTSGTLWATTNIGAEKETDYGLYFQWGATQGYSGDEATSHSYWSTCPGNGGNSSYDSSSFTTWEDEHLTEGVLNADVDAATVNWGSKWKMPTQAQFEELINGTTKEWTTINGVKGYKFTNKSDSSKYIFIPAAGGVYDGGFYYVGDIGYVWSSSLYSSNVGYAWNLSFGSGLVSMNLDDRCSGHSVRPVFVLG